MPRRVNIQKLIDDSYISDMSGFWMCWICPSFGKMATEANENAVLQHSWQHCSQGEAHGYGVIKHSTAEAFEAAYTVPVAEKRSEPPFNPKGGHVPKPALRRSSTASTASSKTSRRSGSVASDASSVSSLSSISSNESSGLRPHARRASMDKPKIARQSSGQLPAERPKFTRLESLPQLNNQTATMYLNPKTLQSFNQGAGGRAVYQRPDGSTLTITNVSYESIVQACKNSGKYKLCADGTIARNNGYNPMWG